MTRCNDCAAGDRPQFAGQVVFKGDFDPPTCECCGDPLPPYDT